MGSAVAEISPSINLPIFPAQIKAAFLDYGLSVKAETAE
jgi:hypothetical protein